MKVSCRRCGAMILPATSDRTGGLCMPCAQGTRDQSRVGAMPAEDKDKTRDTESGKSNETTTSTGTIGDHRVELPTQVPIRELKLELPPLEYKIPPLLYSKLPPLEYKIPSGVIYPVIYSGPTSSPQVTTPSGWFAPRPRRDGLARWWSNGYSFITPKDKPGLCSLKVINGTDRDAVVKMVSEKQSDKSPAGFLCRFVYICAGKSVTIQGIGAGDYRLFFCTGSHWNNQGKNFIRPHAAQKFVEVMNFTQEPKTGSIQYSTNEVTLHPVVGGSARTVGVDQREFDRL